MRILKKEIENISVDWHFEGEHNRTLGRLQFRYKPKEGKTYLEHSDYGDMTVEDGVAMLKLMETLAPKLEKAMNDALREIHTF